MKEQFIKIYRKVFSIETLADECGTLADECVKVADEHAINFAKWCVNTQAFGAYSYEDALEIFKDEKRAPA